MINVKSDNDDDIYAHVPLKDIPWNREEPPAVLVHLVDAGKITPCKTIDLGCGAGNYSIYLAQRGFSITGVDRSPTAIRIAKKQAQKQGVECQFLVLNVSTELDYLKGETTSLKW